LCLFFKDLPHFSWIHRSDVQGPFLFWSKYISNILPYRTYILNAQGQFVEDVTTSKLVQQASREAQPSQDESAKCVATLSVMHNPQPVFVNVPCDQKMQSSIRLCSSNQPGILFNMSMVE